MPIIKYRIKKNLIGEDLITTTFIGFVFKVDNLNDDYYEKNNLH